MATAMDHKADVDTVSDDVVPATEPGRGPSHLKLEPPPLVAAMSQADRLGAEARLRRKIDTRLLPMIILMYIMNYLDRNNIAAVRLAGLQDELNLSSTQYQVCLHAFQFRRPSLTCKTVISILFVGYILMQIPSNLFLNKTGKPAIYLPTCMVIWGVISGATAACNNCKCIRKGGIVNMLRFVRIKSELTERC